MNLIYLQTFLIVADEQSFTQAAKVLNVSKGLVSRHVKKLEDSYNSKLFHRTTRSISLTEVGEELYSRAKQIQLLATEAEMRVKDMTQEVTGDLRVTAPFEFGRILCRHVIPSYTQQYPKINLILDFGPMKKQIEKGDFDIAFRAFDELPNDVVAKELGYIRNVLVCSKSYANQQSLSDIHTISQHAFILNNQNDTWNKLALHSGEQLYEVNACGSVHCNTYHSILELALQGMGLASLPFYQVENLISSGELIHAFPEWSLQTHKLSLIYTQRRVMPKKMSAFNQAVMQWLASNDLYLIADKGKITHC